MCATALSVSNTKSHSVPRETQQRDNLRQQRHLRPAGDAGCRFEQKAPPSVDSDAADCGVKYYPQVEPPLRLDERRLLNRSVHPTAPENRFHCIECRSFPSLDILVSVPSYLLDYLSYRRIGHFQTEAENSLSSQNPHKLITTVSMTMMV